MGEKLPDTDVDYYELLLDSDQAKERDIIVVMKDDTGRMMAFYALNLAMEIGN